MIKFVDDDKNLDEAVKMGLVPKPEERIEKTTSTPEAEKTQNSQKEAKKESKED